MSVAAAHPHFTEIQLCAVPGGRGEAVVRCLPD